MLDDVTLPPMARALLDAAASVEDDGDMTLRNLMEQAVQAPDGDALLDGTIRHAPSMTLAQRLDIGAWLMASQRTFATSVGDITHLVYAIPVLMRVTPPWSPRCTGPARLSALGNLENSLREHGLVRQETVLWTLPHFYSLPELLEFTPIRWRRLNTAAFRRLKAVRNEGWAPFDLADSVWGAPDPSVEEPDATAQVELRFVIGGALDHRANALALWEDPSDPDLLASWVDTLDLWAQDAMLELERASAQDVLQVLPPGPFITARDGGVFAWQEFLFRGTVLNAQDKASGAPLYATLHEVQAINTALGAAGHWQDVSALAIELRRRDDDALLDTFAWPHTGLGDEPAWLTAIVDTLATLGLLRPDMDRVAA